MRPTRLGVNTRTYLRVLDARVLLYNIPLMQYSGIEEEQEAPLGTHVQQSQTFDLLKFPHSQTLHML